MNDPGGHYTDPFEDALSRGAQHAAQLTSLIAAAAQVLAQRRALREAAHAAGVDQQATPGLRDQERTAYRQARLSWTLAHDARWLAGADVLATAQAWGAATCYADTDPAAAAALRRCEDRLRQLHPYAMARYDRLRAEGMSPHEAMRDAAPMFDREPHPHTGQPAPSRPALIAADEQDTSPPGDEVSDSRTPPGPDTAQPERTARRGQQIVAQMQAQARAAGRDELGPAELATVLETVTNLPADVIEQLTRQAAEGSEPRATSRTAAQLAAVSFPHTAAEAVTASSPAALARPGLSTDRSQVRRRGRSV